MLHNDKAWAMCSLLCCGALALGCMLIHPAGWLVRFKDGKHYALITMGWIFVQTVVFCVFWWANTTPHFSQFRLDGFLILLFVVLPPAALLLNIGVYLHRIRTWRISAWLLMITVMLTLCVCVFLLVIRLFTRSFNHYGDMQVVSVTAICLGIGLTCLMAGQWQWYKTLGLVTASLYMTLGCCLKMGMYRSDDLLILGMFISAILGVLIAHVSILQALPIKYGRLERLRSSMFIGDGIFAVIAAISFMIWIRDYDELSDFLDLSMIFAWCIIGLTCLLIYKVVIDHLPIQSSSRRSHLHITHLQIQCPHCSTPQLLTEAGQCCLQCGLQFHFRITEPHCVNCDYLLIGQSSGCCPECGHAIASNSGQAIPAASI